MAVYPKIEKEVSWLSNEDSLRHAISVSLFAVLIFITVCASTGHAQTPAIQTLYDEWRAAQITESGKIMEEGCDRFTTMSLSWLSFISRADVGEAVLQEIALWKRYEHIENIRLAKLGRSCVGNGRTLKTKTKEDHAGDIIRGLYRDHANGTWFIRDTSVPIPTKDLCGPGKAEAQGKKWIDFVERVDASEAAHRNPRIWRLMGELDSSRRDELKRSCADLESKTIAQREEQAKTFIHTQWGIWYKEHLEAGEGTGDNMRNWCVPAKRQALQQSWQRFLARIEKTEDARIGAQVVTFYKTHIKDQQANWNAHCNIDEHLGFLLQNPRPAHRGPGLPPHGSPEFYAEHRDNTPSQAEYDAYDKVVKEVADQRTEYRSKSKISQTLLADVKTQADTDYNKLYYLYLEWVQPYNKGRDAATSGRELGAAFIASIKQWCIHTEAIQQSWADFVQQISTMEEAQRAARGWASLQNFEKDRQASLARGCAQLKELELVVENADKEMGATADKRFQRESAFGTEKLKHLAIQWADDTQNQLVSEMGPNHKFNAWCRSGKHDAIRESWETFGRSAVVMEAAQLAPQTWNEIQKVMLSAVNNLTKLCADDRDFEIAELERYQAGLSAKSDRVARDRYQREALEEMQTLNRQLMAQAEEPERAAYAPPIAWSQSQQRWRRGQGMGPGGGLSMGPGGGLSMGPGGGLSMGPGGGLSMGPGGGLSTGPCGGQSIGPACR